MHDPEQQTPSDQQARATGSVADSEESATEPSSWTSGQLLQGRQEAIIVHDDEVYRLRLTRNNKLILYK